MANFFSLGSGGSGGGATPPQEHSQPNTTTNNNPNNWAANSSHPGLLFYRNEEIYQKGFEIWQQYVQVHHHPKLFHHQDHHQPFLHHGLYLGGGGGVDQMAGPSNLSGARSSSSGSRVMMRGGSSGGAGVGGINCQDCGNQAKKDCSHMRCRTCCKSRGFDCSTHVKSTWVPAAKRRERQQQQQQQHSSEIGMMREKRQRESSTTANNPAAGSSRMGASTSGLEMGQHFPPEVSSPAMFRCVRVQSVENADEQLAYQTAVNIGGHLFKGILYDQGPDAHYSPAAAGDASSGGDPTIQHQNLLASTSNNNPENASSSGVATCVDPNAIYPPPISAFLAGTQFFPPPRS
ncbi:hypothetical protein V2J09_023771 [Rumex salicifolius]